MSVFRNGSKYLLYSACSPEQAAASPRSHPRDGRGTYHAARRVHLAVRHALEVAAAAAVVAGAVPDRPEGGEQVIDGFEVGGQHRFFPWREKAPLERAGRDREAAAGAAPHLIHTSNHSVRGTKLGRGKCAKSMKA